MFFGGDQFKNHISNNLIIKCHECGNTNLRYVDTTRTGAVGSGYICGNGHETFGAIDDQEIHGQTDSQLSSVNDCCCEGVECNLPKSISVVFEGIEGVQLKEACTHMIADELLSRSWLPIGDQCRDCCSVNQSYANSSWDASCGCDSLTGPCTESTDGTADPGSRQYSTVLVDNGLQRITEYAKYTVWSEVPAERFGAPPASPIDSNLGYWLPKHPNLPATCDSCNLVSSLDGQSFVMFEQGYPGGYRAETPAFITEVFGSTGNSWNNEGHSIWFYIKQLVRIEETINENLQYECSCFHAKTTVNVIKRIHPSVNPQDALPQFDFSEPDNEGIAFSEIAVQCEGGCTAPSFDPGWDGPGGENQYPTVVDFCDMSNELRSCTNCNSAHGDIIATTCNNNTGATVWPYRIPHLHSAQFSPTEYQFFERNKAGMSDFPIANECLGCTCDTSDDYPEYCSQTLEYIPCMEVGTKRCSGEDAKYRMPCSNPTDKFSVTYDTNPDDSVLRYRYSIDISNYTGFRSLEDVYVGFRPVYSTFSDGQPYDFWVYPPHPNPKCAAVATCPGFLRDYGDPSDWNQFWYDGPTKFNNLSDDIQWPSDCYAGESYGAAGVSVANLAVLLGDARFKVEQPHCARRVKNADLFDKTPFYAVNTDDVSNQTIILDRYYPTGGSYDYMWSGQKLSEDGEASQAYIKNRGDIGLTDGSRFPYPFIANSGSLEEPELIAIIHSESGVGGQVAFQTFPVSYDSDVLVEPYYFNQTEFSQPYGVCPYKTRLTVHGYGVMYPLRDDPIWSLTSSSLPTQYDPNNPPVSKSTFEYPVLIPGTDYKIGDKIEFRCWKTLEDSATRYDQNGVPIPTGVDEIDIWKQECVETIIATATITELNDERLAPQKVKQTIDQATIKVTVAASGTTRYNETYKLASVNVNHIGSGYFINQSIDIEFEDTNAFEGVKYDVQPSIIVTETGVGGKINAIEIEESGVFYKIVRTGGIRWYEFDETDIDDNPLISIGNCPCSYDVCSNQDCAGCVSKNMYPSGHYKLNSSPFNPYENIVAKQVRSYYGEPWYKPFDPITGDDAEGCATDQSITAEIGFGNAQSEQLIPLYCPVDNGFIRDCNENCDGHIPCDNNCSCGENGCQCYREEYHPLTVEFLDGNGEKQESLLDVNLYYIGGWDDRSDFPKCWPNNNSWDFDNATSNYGLSACSGYPVESGTRPYASGHIIIPPKRPQFKYIWQPNTQAFLGGFEGLLFIDPLTEDKDTIVKQTKTEFLSIEGCNPLRLDRFGKSYKFLDPTGEKEYGAYPCRKINEGDPTPSGHDRTLDNYCRVYGFYQQRQPSCEIEYRGQYIMRAAQRRGYNGGLSCPDVETGNTNYLFADGLDWSDCEPIIANIKINLAQIESKFDVSVGAPYNQDFLIPEQLPEPILGADGKYETTADPWDEPSLNGTNNNRFFDHGFYEPNIYGRYEEKTLPENEAEVGNEIGAEPGTTSVFVINPVFNMPSVDGGDYVGDLNRLYDMFKQSVWDLPDPRSNCRPGVSGIECDDLCEIPEYAVNAGMPASGTRNDLRSLCPYPWESWGTNTENNGIDYFCMFKNNSAEIVIDEIVECDDCIGTGIVRYDYITQGNPEYPTYFWYTYREAIATSPTETVYLYFRLYGNFDNIPVNTTYNAFYNIVQDYKDKFNERYTDASLGPTNLDLYTLLLSDVHRTIFFNMVFQGSSTNYLDNLTKVEIFISQDTSIGGGASGPSGPSGPVGVGSSPVSKIFSEDRCDMTQRSGSIKSLKVQNGGNNYAFEIEERVPPSGVVQNISDASLSVVTIFKDSKRRRETYQVSGVVIDHSGTGYSVDQIIPISFNDTDYRRGNIKIITQPTVKITEVDSETGAITDWRVEQSGEFYKYVGTGEHRAYPVAVVLNNYWDHPNGSQNFGRHAKFRPVIGVDPEDPKTYGTIKRIEVDFGGIDYVMPGKHWKIDTTMGEYNQYGDLQAGLDIEHLVDPCKYKILTPEGLSSDETTAFIEWANGGISTAAELMDIPSKSSYYDPETRQGNRFGTSVKHYTRTEPMSSPVLWENKVNTWSTILSSGSCPIDGSGNLLDRSYNMALIEEGYLWNGVPVHGNCTNGECNDYIDENCYWDGYANSPYPVNCGSPCPVFTVYDAHRFNVGHTNSAAGAFTFPFYDVKADTPPYIEGCQRRIDLDPTNPQDRATLRLFCFGLTPEAYGGELMGKGFREYKHLNSSSDRCSSASYSHFIEMGLTYSEKSQDVPYLRSKAITYGMSKPIKMTISYDKDIVPTYSGVCQSGLDSNLSSEQSISLAGDICGCGGN